MFSGLGGIGDWQAVIAGAPHYLAWRIGLALAGVAGYCVSTWIALRVLAPFLGATDPERLARANRLTILPYLAGGVLYVSAGLLNPESPWLVLISAAAASFGGASALAWMSQLLHDRRRFPPASAAAVGIGKSWPWLVAGTLATAVFIALLGPGIILAAAR